MSKELPFFKFTPTEWLVGKISFQPLEVQGAFIQCCCMYWKQNGLLTRKDIDYRAGKQNMNTLVEYEFVKEDEFGNLKIDFLEEQLLHFSRIRSKRAEIGAVGGIAKAKKSIAIANESVGFAKQSVADIRVKSKDTYINNSLMSEIKISDDEKYFILKGEKVDPKGDDIKYFKIAESFRRIFIKNLTDKEAPVTNQKNAKFSSYTNPIRHMMEIDEVTIEQIREASTYLKSPEGEFWKSNILSTKKLREKISVLLAKKNEVKTSNQKVDFKNNIQVPDPKKRNKI